MNGNGKTRFSFAAIAMAAAVLATMTACRALRVGAEVAAWRPVELLGLDQKHHSAREPVFQIENGVLIGVEEGDVEEMVVPEGVKTVCIDGLTHGRTKVVTS